MDEATLSMYASKVWDGTKWCYPHLEKLLQEKATLQAQLDAKDYPIKWASDALDNSSARVATLEAELTAEREAVRVLKDECSLANKVIVGNAECHTLILNCHITAYREWTAAQSRTDANRIASAAITDAAKAREGA